MTDQQLMAQIEERWGSVIAKVCAKSSVPGEFVAALIANETGGDPTKTRFEEGVYRHLLDVQQDRAIRYGAITKRCLIDLDDEALRLLATSRGLTQVMSYNAVFQHVDPSTLTDAELCLTLTLHLLANGAECYWLDETKEFEQMFRVWNTGRPDGETYDPNYVSRGLARMRLYSEI